jgi:hypothetical protein
MKVQRNVRNVETEARFLITFYVSNDGGKGSGVFSFELDADQIYRGSSGCSDPEHRGLPDDATDEMAADFLAEWIEDEGVHEVFDSLEIFNWVPYDLDIKRIN